MLDAAVFGVALGMVFMLFGYVLGVIVSLIYTASR